MKKLTFALACAATVAAFSAANADEELPNPFFTQMGFEDYAAPATGLSGKDDAGGTSGDIFWSQTDGTDASTVKAYGTGEGEIAVPSSDNYDGPIGFSEWGSNYLELSTEGATLWRSINAAATGIDDAVAETVPEDGLYIDTMVQFTATEGDDPDVGAGDKLAIWLKDDGEGNKCLCVKAGLVDDSGSASSVTPKTYTLANTSTIAAGTWYRLTVKAIKDVDQRMARNANYDNGLTGFQIYLDGNLLSATEPSFTQGYIDLAKDAGEWGWLDETETADAQFLAFLQSGSVFVGATGFENSSTLTSVGFKGSGAIDNLSIGTADPFAQAPAGDEYKVTIGDSDVVIIPTTEQINTVKAALASVLGTEPTVAQINAALAAPIGTTTTPTWQALFLGLAPTEEALATFKLDAITLADGKVQLALAEGVDPQEVTGVSITLKVMASDDLENWTQAGTLDSDGEAEIEPDDDATKKFYKVVAEFAPAPAAE